MKLNSFHRPKFLREAMDVTMDIEVEHQITQPESQLAVMETCYEEPMTRGNLHDRRSSDEVTGSTETRSTTSRKSILVPEA